VTTPLGAVDPATCEPAVPKSPLAAVDFIIQMKVSIKNVLQFKAINPCQPAAASFLEEAKQSNPYKKCTSSGSVAPAFGPSTGMPRALIVAAE
jgi:hypothetical protein